MKSTCCRYCAHRRYNKCVAPLGLKPEITCEYLKGGKCKLPKDGECYACGDFERRGKK